MAVKRKPAAVSSSPSFALRPLAGFICRASLPVGLVLSAGTAFAGPQGGQVVGGQGKISTPNATTTVINQYSNKLALDWTSFNVNTNELVQFNQPSATASALNRIFDQSPSQILGSIRANGEVILVNPNGLIFGPNASVKVNSLIAAGLNISTDDYMAGKYNFTSPDGGGGLVVNQGLIEAATGGSVTMIGGAVQNQGLILATAGQVTLAAGNQVTMDFDGDGLIQFTVNKEVLKNAHSLDSAVSNSGEIDAAGGQVLLTAKAAKNVFTDVVNNSGVIRAGRIENQGGTIRLVAGGDGASAVNTGTLDASGTGGDGGTVEIYADGAAVTDDNSTINVSSDSGTGGTASVLGSQVELLGLSSIDASGSLGGGAVLIGGDFHGANPDVKNATVTTVSSGATINADATDSGDGGRVAVWADHATNFAGTVSARGGEQGGDGGFVEVSGKGTLSFAGYVDTRAPEGQAGHLLLDPRSLDIVAGTSVTGGQLGTTVLNPLLGAGNVTISSQGAYGTGTGTGRVTFDSGASVNWTSGYQLTVIADDSTGPGNNTANGTIEVQSGVTISGSGGANVVFNAGNVTLASVINVDGTLSGTATTVNVDAGGSVQNGIDVVNTSSGGTVNVGSGTFVGDLSITTNNIDLSGNGAGNSIIQGVGTQTGFPDATASTNINLSANNVKIHGFTIESPIADATTNAYSSGIVIDGSNVEIYDNTLDIRQSGTGTFDGNTSVAIQTVSTANDPSVDISGLNIHDNLFTYTPSSGTGNGYYGIYLNPDTGVGTVTIDNNTMTGSIWRGITTERGNVTISDNTITTDTPNTAGNNSGIRVVNFGGGAVSNVNVSGNTISGLSSGDGFAFAIGLGSGSGETLSNVTVTQNKIVGDNNIAVDINNSSGGIVLGGGSGDGNDLSGFKSGGVALRNNGGGTVDASGNYWGVTTGTGIAGVINNVTASDKVDFSPFLNSGTDVGTGTAGFQGDYSDLTVTQGGAQTSGLIQEGIDDAASTATVSVESGTYAENLTISLANLTLKGATGTPSDVVVAPTTGVAISVAGTNGVTIQDLEVSNGGTVSTGINATGTGAETFSLSNVKATGLPAGFDISGFGTVNLSNLSLTGNTLGGGLAAINTVNYTTGAGNDTITLTPGSIVHGTDDAISYVYSGGSKVGNLVVDSGAGDDTINIRPNLTTDTLVTIYGSANSSTGDTLNIDDVSDTLNGPATRTLSGGNPQVLTLSNTGGTQHYSLQYSGVENVALNSAAALPNVDVTLNAGGSGSTFTIETDGSGNLVVVQNDGSGNYDPFNGDLIGVSTLGGLVVNGGAGNDTLTVDYTNGNPGNFTFNGGGQTGTPGDSLVIAGGSFVPGAGGTDVYNFTGGGVNGFDGNIVLDSTGTPTTITFTGLEPISNSGSAANIIFNLPTGTANVATLADDGTTNDGVSQLTGTTFENTTFTDPTTSLTINLGNSGDTLNLAGVDLQWNAALAVNDGTGTDTVNVTGVFNTSTLTALTSLTVKAENINFSATGTGAGAASASVYTTGAQSYIGAVTINANTYLTAGTDVTVTGNIEDGTTTTDTLNVSAGTAGSATFTAGVGDITALKAFDVTQAGTVNLGGDVKANSVSIPSVTSSINLGTGVDVTALAGSVNLAGTSGQVNLTGSGSANVLTAMGNANTVSLGSVIASGSTKADLTINSEGSLSLSNSISLGTGTFKANIDTNNSGTDTLTLGSSITAASITLKGGTDNNDNLVGQNKTSTWNITAAHAGKLSNASLSTQANFSQFQNLTGGTKADTFNIGTGAAVAWAGNLTGGAGNDTFVLGDGSTVVGTIKGGSGADTIDWSGYTTQVGAKLTNIPSSGASGTVTNGSAIAQFTGIDKVIGRSATGVGGDFLQGPNATTNAWTISGSDKGKISSSTGVLNFSHIANLTGGVSADNFVFNNGATISGTIRGGSGTDTLDWSSYATARHVTISGITANGASGAEASIKAGVAGGFTGIDVFKANRTLATGTNSITGPNVATTWTIGGTTTHSDIGTISTTTNSVTFNGFGKLVGGTAADSFQFTNSGSLSGSIDGGGGAGVNNLVGGNVANTWTLTASKTGTMGAVPSFKNINNVTGGSGSDTFNINSNWSGKVDGGAGSDTFIMGGAYSVGTLTGGSGTDTLVGPNFVNTWNLTGSTQGSLVENAGAATVAFSGIENVTGGAANDTFNDSGNWSGHIGGGGGTDNLVGPNTTNTWTLTGSKTGTMSAGGASFSNIENVTGGSSNDTFIVTGTSFWSGHISGGAGTDNLVGPDTTSTNTWTLTGAKTGTMSAGGASFSNIENVTGGGGTDVFNINANWPGKIDGSFGRDTFKMGGAYTVGTLTGGSGTDTLIGPDFVNTWNLTGTNKGSLVENAGAATVVFNGIENVSGGAAADTFNIGTATSTFTWAGNINGGGGNDVFMLNGSVGVSGTMDGGAGVDTINWSGYTSPGYIGASVTSLNSTNGASGSITGTGGASFAFSHMEAVVGRSAGNTGDFISGPTAVNTWKITGADQGELDSGGGVLTFTNIPNLTGNSQADDFIFSDGASISFVHGHAGFDTIDWSAYSTARNVLITNITPNGAMGTESSIPSFAGIDAFIGPTGATTASTLNGPSTTTNWTIGRAGTANLVDAGALTASAVTIKFDNFSKLVGGAGSDTFTLTNGGRLSAGGQVDGGGGVGSDILIGDASSNLWHLTSNKTGDVGRVTTGDAVPSFVNIESVTGGSGADTFNISSNWSGSIYGGLGNDSFVFTGSYTVGGQIDGGGGVDNIVGPDVANTWNLTGAKAGNLNSGGVSFTRIENVTGGSAADTFNIGTGASTFSWSGNISGGSGNDSFKLLGSSKVVGTIDGGVGTDTIDWSGSAITPVGASVTNLSSLSGGASGRVITAGPTNIANFSHIEAVVGHATPTTTFGDAVFGPDAAATWEISGIDTGKLMSGGGTLTFTNIPYLSGGNQQDTFIFDNGSKLSVGINGGSGTAVDTIDWSAYTTARSVQLSDLTSNGASGSETTTVPSFSGIDVIIGANGTPGLMNTLHGVNGTSNSWTIGRPGFTNTNAGTLSANTGTLTFEKFSKLVGGNSTDTFTVQAGGKLTGQIDGGGGTNNSLVGSDSANTWTLTGNGVGKVGRTGTSDEVASFTNIYNVTGGNTVDTFNIGTGGAIVWTGNINGGSGNDIFNVGTTSKVIGTIDGGAGSDTMDWSGYGSRILVEVGNLDVNGADGKVVNGTTYANFANMETVVGRNVTGPVSGDAVQGPNESNTWTIGGATNTDAGKLTANSGTFTFKGFANFTGGTATDTFKFNNGAKVTGYISGGNGLDTLDWSLYTSPRHVTVTGLTIEGAKGSESSIGGGFSRIDVVVGAGITGTAGDTLKDPIVGTSNWTIGLPGTHTDAGTLSAGAGTLTFVGFANLTGGTNADVFTVATSGKLTGKVDGGAGPGINTLIGSNTTNTWNLTGAHKGTLSPSIPAGFTRIDNVTGGNSTDTFNDSGSWAGHINGGGGTDNLAGPNTTNTWTLSGSKTGTMTAGGASFSNIENVTGGSQPDTFNVNALVDWPGDISGGAGNDKLVLFNNATVGNFDGGAGTDTIDWSNYTTSVGAAVFGVSSSGAAGILEHGPISSPTPMGSFTHVESVTGRGAGTFSTGDFVIGPSSNNTWTIAGTNGGNLAVGGNALAFNGIALLIGNTQTDTFVFDNGAKLTGGLEGNFPPFGPSFATDTIDWSAYTTARNVQVTNINSQGAKGSELTSLPGFSGIEVIIGANGAPGLMNSLTGPNLTTSWTIGRTGSNTDAGTLSNGAATVTFEKFSNLTGGNKSDTFTVQSGGKLTGQLDGGTNVSGTNSLVASNTTNIWNLTGGKTGTLTPGVDAIGFKNITNVTGGAAADTFNIGTGTTLAWSGNISGAGGDDLFVLADKATVGGTIDGGTGSNTLDWSQYTSIIGTFLNNITAGGASGELDTGASWTAIWTATFTTVAQFSHIKSVVGSAVQQDFLVGPNQPGTVMWTIQGTDAGKVSTAPGSTLAFSGMPSLTGGDGPDTFKFDDGAKITRYILGNHPIDTSTATDTIDWSSYSTARHVHINGFDTSFFTGGTEIGAYGSESSIPNFSGIDVLIGAGISGPSGDTIQGPNTTTNWTIGRAGTSNLADAGSLTTGGDTLRFDGFANLTGNTAHDTFTVTNGGHITGKLDGGTGATNTLIGDNVASNWNLTGNKSGTLTPGVPAGFVNIDNVTGGSATDTFNIGSPTTTINWSGSISGGAGSDTFNLYGTSTVGGGIHGGAGTDNLQGPNVTSNWLLTGASSGQVFSPGPPTAFDGIENVTGGSKADTFSVVPSVTWSGNISGGAGNDKFVLFNNAGVGGTIDGGAGTDTIDWSNYTSTFGAAVASIISSGAAGVLLHGPIFPFPSIKGNFTHVEAVTGRGAGNLSSGDYIFGPIANNTWTIAGTNSGNLSVGGNMLAFSGIATLIGSTATDTFKFDDNAKLTGGILGNPPLSSPGATDTIDWSAYTTARNVQLIGVTSYGANGSEATSLPKFFSIDVIIGASGVAGISGTAGNTLAGPNSNANWTIGRTSTHTDAGTVAGVSGTLTFEKFSNLTGGNSNDTFTVQTSGVLTGRLDGGLGTNNLVASNATNIWHLTNSKTGTLNPGVSATGFKNITNVTGGSGPDTFNIGTSFSITWIGNIRGGNGTNLYQFHDGSAVNGRIYGGTGNDTIDWSSYTTSRNVTVTGITSDGAHGKQSSISGGAANGFTAIDTLIGASGTNNYLHGPDTTANWSITGANSGSLSVGTNSVSWQKFNNLTGGTADDTFKVVNPGSLTGVLNGGSGTGVNTLIGADVNNSWNLNGSRSGTLNPGVTTAKFTNIDNVVGGTKNDTFYVNNYWNGSIDGDAGTDTIDWSGYGSTVNVTVNGFTANGANGTELSVNNGFKGIDVLNGETAFSSSNSLQGPDAVTSWSINGHNAGTLSTGTHSLAWNNFAHLTGGTKADTFTVVAPSGSLTGSLDGGTGSGINTLVGANANNSWSLTGSRSGYLSPGVSGTGFSRIDNLVGGTKNDTFVMNNSGSGGWAGSIDGGAGFDTIDWSIYGTAVHVAVSGFTSNGASGTESSVGGGFKGIDAVVGAGFPGTTGDSIKGPDTTANWSITGTNSGTLTVGTHSLAWSQFPNLTGGSGSDTFTIVTPGNVTGILDGGAGTGAGHLNTLVGGNTNSLWHLSGTRSGYLTPGVSNFYFTRIDNVVGGNASDTFNVSANWAGNISGAGGNDTVFFTSNYTVGGSIDGGTGTDTIDWSSYGSARNVTVNGFTANGASGTESSVSGGFKGINSVKGYTAVSGTTGNTLNGPNVATTWVIPATQTDAGTLSTAGGSLAFADFSNLNGGNAADTFTLNTSAKVTGSITGGAGNDTFKIGSNAVVGGMVDGGSGTDTLDWSSYGSARHIIIDSLTGGSIAGHETGYTSINGTGATSSFFNMETLVSAGVTGTAGDSLQGLNTATTWNIGLTPTHTDAGTMMTGGGTLTFKGFANLVGGNVTDAFIVNTSGSLTGKVDGGSGGPNRLQGSGAANTWNLKASKSGTLTASIPNGFVNITNVTGGSVTDTFNVGNSITTNVAWSGNISGGNGANTYRFYGTSTVGGNVVGGVGVDTIDWSNYGSARHITVSTLTAAGAAGSESSIFGNFSNIEKVIGAGFTGTTGDSLNAPSLGANATWTITGTDQGNVASGGGTLNYQQVANLTGGSQNDTFIVSGGSQSGLVDGGSGTNNLKGDNTASTWNLTNAKSGTLSPGISAVGFINITNITGNAAADTFNVGNPTTTTVAWSGNISGGNGSNTYRFYGASTVGGNVVGGVGIDTIDWSNYSSGRHVYIDSLGASGADGHEASIIGTGTPSSFFGIEKVIGANSGDQLTGPDAVSTWTITGTDQGNLVSGGGTLNYQQIANLTGGSQNDTFIVSGGSQSGLVDGGSGTNNLIGDNTVNTWNLTGVKSGTLSPGISTTGFKNITNVTGGSTSDTFNIGSNWSGNISGMGGSDSFVFQGGYTVAGSISGGTGYDTIDWTSYGSGRHIFINTLTAAGAAGSESSISGGFSGIEQVIGANSNDQLTGPNAVSTWTITGADSGNLVSGGGTLDYQQVANLTGGSQSDTFIVSGGSQSGLVDGGAGLNNIIGDNTTNTWNLTGSTSGTLTPGLPGGFKNIYGLTGGSKVDTFNISTNWSGYVDGRTGNDLFVFGAGSSVGAGVYGGAGSDTIDWSSYGSARHINVTNMYTQGATGTESSITGFFYNIETVIGANSGDQLTGPDAVATWTITGTDQGNLVSSGGTLNYQQVANLTGGTKNDTFIVSGGSQSGLVDGGSGTNNLIGDNTVNVWNLTGAKSGTLSPGISAVGFINITNVTGNAATDTFNVGNPTTTTVAWSGNISGGNGLNTYRFYGASTVGGSVAGGSGTDTIDWSNYGSARNIIVNTLTAAGAAGSETSISGGFSGIEVVVGAGITGTVGDSLNAPALGGAATWTITGSDQGTLVSGGGTLSYQQVANLTGGSQNDTFIVSGGSQSGLVDGGTGTNNLIGDTTANTWTLTGPKTGTLSPGVSAVGFINITNVTGGSTSDTFSIGTSVAWSGNISGSGGNDVFEFGDNASVGGVVDGGTGTDEIDWSNYSTARHVTVTNLDGSGADGSETSIVGGFANIEEVVGAGITGTAGDSVSAPGLGGTVTWTVTGADSGSLSHGGGTLDFQQVANLNGGTQNDIFQFNDSASISGSLVGNGGTNTIDWSAYTTPRAITVTTLNSSGANGTEGNGSIGGTFSNIQNITGSGIAGTGGDTLTGPNVSATWTFGAVSSTVTDSGSLVATGGTLNFSGISNYQGGNGNDYFLLLGRAIVSGNINGGSGSDYFQFNRSTETVGWRLAHVLGSLDGGGTVGIDTLDFQNSDMVVTSAVNGPGTNHGQQGTVTDYTGSNDYFNDDLLGSGYDNVDVFIGNNGPLQGPNSETWWDITGTNSGSFGNSLANIGNTSFTNFSIIGGSKTDVFIIEPAGVMQGLSPLPGIDGGSGTNTLVGSLGDDTFDITGATSLTFTPSGGLPTDLENINNINGNSITTGSGTTVIGDTGADTFNLAAAWAGNIDGAAGNDTLNLSALSPVTVTLTSVGSIDGYAGNSSVVGSFDNIDVATGGAGQDTLVANIPAGGTFNVSTTNTYTSGANTLTFGSFENLTGGSGADTFNVETAFAGNLNGAGGDDLFSLDASLTGNISGGAGNDTINLNSGTHTGLVSGGSGNDTFTVAAGTVQNGVVTGDAGDDTFIVNGGTISSAVSGGSGNDTFTLNSGAINGNLSGDAGNDTFTFNANFNKTLSGGTGNDIFNFAGGTVSGPLSGDTGKNTYNFTGGSVTGVVTIGGDDTWNYAAGKKLGSTILGGTATSLTVPGVLNADLTIGAADLALPTMTAFDGHLIIGGTLTPPTLPLTGATVTVVNTNLMTLTDPLVSNGPITLLSHDIILNNDITTSSDPSAQIAMITVGSSTTPGDITAIKVPTVITGGSAIFITAGQIQQAENIILNLDNGNGTVQTAFGQGLSAPAFGTLNAKPIQVQADTIAYILALGLNLNTTSISSQFNFAQALIALKQLANIDVGLFQQDLNLFGIIGQGVALALAQCEEMEGCAPNVTDTELAQIILQLQARIDELQKRIDAETSDSEKAKLQALLDGYKEQLAKFEEYRRELKAYTAGTEEEDQLQDEFTKKNQGGGGAPATGESDVAKQVKQLGDIIAVSKKRVAWLESLKSDPAAREKLKQATGIDLTIENINKIIEATQQEIQSLENQVKQLLQGNQGKAATPIFWAESGNPGEIHNVGYGPALLNLAAVREPRAHQWH